MKGQPCSYTTGFVNIRWDL